MNKTLRWLRIAGITEGISFLVLMCIAMPLKYFYDQPMAVKLTGWLHGILFIIFMALALIYKTERRKTLTWLLLAFIAALVPLGTFIFDKKVLKTEFRNDHV
ncbi:MAG: DUF3817 domain-containing protein [Ferruginibacter sp.]